MYRPAHRSNTLRKQHALADASPGRPRSRQLSLPEKCAQRAIRCYLSQSSRNLRRIWDAGYWCVRCVPKRSKEDTPGYKLQIFKRDWLADKLIASDWVSELVENMAYRNWISNNIQTSLFYYISTYIRTKMQLYIFKISHSRGKISSTNPKPAPKLKAGGHDRKLLFYKNCGLNTLLLHNWSESVVLRMFQAAKITPLLLYVLPA